MTTPVEALYATRDRLAACEAERDEARARLAAVLALKNQHPVDNAAVSFRMGYNEALRDARRAAEGTP